MKRIGFCAALLLVGVLLQTSQAQGQLSCEARTIALEMNTVRVDNLVKTIAVEKEVITCVECNQGACQPLGSQVQDLQLFTELIERKTGDTFEIVDRRFEAILCTKDPSTARLLGCRLVPVPGRLEPPPIPGGCQGGAEGRVAMNTIVVGNLVKTIKAQKEEFRCNASVVDLTTFTEIIEKKEGGTFRIVDKRLEQAVCRKGVVPTTNPNSPRFLDFVTLEGCGMFPVQLEGPRE